MLDGRDTRTHLLHCLWLARALPYPMTAGDRIYSLKLASALADAGAQVTFVGLSVKDPPGVVPGVRWHVIQGKPRWQFSALVSLLPLVAARHATQAYRAEAALLVRSRRWDAVVIDHYGCGWLQPIVKSAADGAVRVFVAHNHEASVTESQWRGTTNTIVKKGYLWQNWLKTRRLESIVARDSDLITAITDVDAKQFAREAPRARTIEITPGYDGKRVASRTITAKTARSLVLFGSYLWSAKRANLISFLDRASSIVARAGITIDIIGDIDERLQRALSGRYPVARFHGFVEDATPFLEKARIAVVAEPIGGGFKLKLLEYIFNRVPIAALTACANGLPEIVRAHMLLSDNIVMLIQIVVANIDNFPRLNALHEGAYEAAKNMFGWEERGQELRNAIKSLSSRAGGSQSL